MEAYYAEYLRLLEMQLDAIKQAVADLPVAALDWVPGPEMNSLAVLAAHTAGATRFLLGDIIGRDSSGRVREAEFKIGGQDAAALVARLDAVLAHSRGVLESLTLADLEGERISPRDGRPVTVAWALLHALEHAAQHAGHAQITRQLWEQRT